MGINKRSYPQGFRARPAKALLSMTSLPQPRRTDLAPDGGLSALVWPGETGGRCLLLHGLGDCAWIWEPVVAAWPGPRPTFIAPDLPGHGQSPAAPLKDCKSARIADRMGPALASGVGDGPVWIAGHSAGARVAVGLARGGALAVSGLSLVDAAVAPGPEARGRIMAHVALLRRGAGSAQALAEALAAQDPLADAGLLARYVGTAGREGGAGWHVPVGRGAEALMSSDIDMASELALIDCPVQIIRGAYSSFCPAETASTLADAARDPLPVVTIAKAGHAIGMDQPATLAVAMADAMPA